MRTPEPMATYEQRRELSELHTVLGRSLKGIRDLTAKEADAALEDAREAAAELSTLRRKHGPDVEL